MKMPDFFEIIVMVIVAVSLMLFASSIVIELSGKISGSVVKAGNTVKVEYTGSFENGTVFDNSQQHGQPLEFKVGVNEMIQGFDKAVVGMKKGGEKTIKLQPSEAYGDYKPDLVATFSKDELPKGKEVKPGMMILVASQDGQQVPALIKEVNEKNFTIDLNHPLAGRTLIFKIKIIDISS